MGERLPEKCGHGVPLVVTADCPECDIAWHEEGLREARRLVDYHTRKLEAAKAVIAADYRALLSGATA